MLPAKTTKADLSAISGHAKTGKQVLEQLVQVGRHLDTCFSWGMLQNPAMMCGLNKQSPFYMTVKEASQILGIGNEAGQTGRDPPYAWTTAQVNAQDCKKEERCITHDSVRKMLPYLTIPEPDRLGQTPVHQLTTIQYTVIFPWERNGPYFRSEVAAEVMNRKRLTSWMRTLMICYEKARLRRKGFYDSSKIATDITDLLRTKKVNPEGSSIVQSDWEFDLFEYERRLLLVPKVETRTRYGVGLNLLYNAKEVRLLYAYVVAQRHPWKPIAYALFGQNKEKAMNLITTRD